MTFLVEYFFAGVWSLVWHWGLGIGLVILCLFMAWFSPLWKKDFLWAAVVVVMALVFEAVGVHDEAVICNARTVVVEKQVHKVVVGTKNPKAKQKKDPFDNPKF
jgi:hypothetical protein